MAQITVSDRNDQVFLKVGNNELPMSYNAALEIASLLRLHGKRAKRFAGDTSCLVLFKGLLTSAEADFESEVNLHQI